MKVVIEEIEGVDHIGYAVRDMHYAKEIFGAFGYEFTTEKEDKIRKVMVSVGILGTTRIELLSPVDPEKSPINGIIDKMGSTPYHICYCVNNMSSALEKLYNLGFNILEQPEVSEVLCGKVCFLYSFDIGIIELIEYPSRNGNCSNQ